MRRDISRGHGGETEAATPGAERRPDILTPIRNAIRVLRITLRAFVNVS
jgi:hypothetical protein